MHLIHISKIVSDHNEPVDLALWFGNAGDCRNPALLHSNGIQCVVDLAWEESPAELPRGLLYHRVPLSDSADNEPSQICVALDAIIGALHHEFTTLVCCSAGASRSPVFCAAALSRISGIAPVECLTGISEIHPLQVHSGLWQSVINVLEKK